MDGSSVSAEYYTIWACPEETPAREEYSLTVSAIGPLSVPSQSAVLTNGDTPILLASNGPLPPTVGKSDESQTVEVKDFGLVYRKCSATGRVYRTFAKPEGSPGFVPKQMRLDWVPHVAGDIPGKEAAIVALFENLAFRYGVEWSVENGQIWQTPFAGGDCKTISLFMVEAARMIGLKGDEVGTVDICGQSLN